MRLSSDDKIPELSAGNKKDQVTYFDALEAQHKNTNWWTVFAAFDLPDFEPSPLWISARTGVAVEEVVEALEGLATLGYLEKSNGAFYPKKDRPFLTFDFSRADKEDIIDRHALVSQQILNDLNVNARFAFDHRCFAANTKILTELYRDIAAAFERAFEKSQAPNQTNDGIFKITFTAVESALQQKAPKGGRKS